MLRYIGSHLLIQVLRKNGGDSKQRGINGGHNRSDSGAQKEDKQNSDAGEPFRHVVQQEQGNLFATEPIESWELRCTDQTDDEHKEGGEDRHEDHNLEGTPQRLFVFCCIDALGGVWVDRRPEKNNR